MSETESEHGAIAIPVTGIVAIETVEAGAPHAAPSDVQILKEAGDLTSAVAFVSDIPEADYQAEIRDEQPALGVTDTRSNRARRGPDSTRLRSATPRPRRRP